VTTPCFSPPRVRRVTLTRPVWVKGRGLPADGVQLFRAGEEATLVTDNGADWYLLGYHRGHELRVATLPSTL
jgi:hypothetical protein